MVLTQECETSFGNIWSIRFPKMMLLLPKKSLSDLATRLLLVVGKMILLRLLKTSVRDWVTIHIPH